ncbi:MAG: extracellular solute-binding protein [Alphaproteobacteria bacterium]|nr:extracellular solute-binding protein [Alphaproteobacteria bacterium]
MADAIEREDDMTEKLYESAGRSRILWLGAFAVAAVLALPAAGADLPKATRDMLKELKMDAGILSGLDDELKMPADWIAKAKKEGTVRYIGNFSNDEWPAFIAPFNARFPSIKISHQRTSRVGRVDKPVIAFKEGRVIADVIAAVGAGMKLYRDAGALADLSDLPNFQQIVPQMRAKDGRWIGEKVKYWCMAYNTGLLKKKDLPARWEDFLTIKALHNQNIGMSNRPHNWILPLWAAKGEDWTVKFIDGMFTTVRPQLRKEGARAIVTLAIAGEFHVALPATDYRVFGYAEKGAPIAWHCPEPVPVTISELIIIKGAKNYYSSKIFLNWFLSKEGQLAQYYTTKASPVHKDLQDKGMVQYWGEIKGKQTAVRTPESLISIFPRVQRVWNKAWAGAGGSVAGSSTVKAMTKLTAVQRGGRLLKFTVKGGEHQVKMSRSRSEVVIGGKPASRGKLKVGMSCEISYLGNGNEARKVSCK